MYLYITALPKDTQNHLINSELDKLSSIMQLPTVNAFLLFLYTFSALTLLVGQQEGHTACKN